MRKPALGVFALLCALSVSAQGASQKIGGVEVPDAITVESNELKLNGAGIRSKWWMSLYVASLYLPEELHGTSDADRIIDADRPMAITIDVVSSKVTSDKMASAANDGFKRTTDGNTAPIRDEIDQLTGVFVEEIEPGDHFRIVYLPDKGIVVYKNGERAGTVKAGMEFKRPLFAIWLGDEPAEGSLKKAMLGRS